MNLKLIVSVFFTTIVSSIFGQQPAHQDSPFIQDYSVKYYFEEDINPKKVFSDRNGSIRILTETDIKIPHNGHFLYPGTFVNDKRYRTASKKNISTLSLLENEFIFTDDKHIFSQARAGELFLETPFPRVSVLAGDAQFNFVISNGKNLALISKEKTIYSETFADSIIDIKHTKSKFWILKKDGLFTATLNKPKPSLVLKGKNFTSFAITEDEKTIYIGTPAGYLEHDVASSKSVLKNVLPVINVKNVTVIGEKIWFGTPEGAFSIDANQKINYYNGERWLPDNKVIHIEKGPENSVLILTTKGLGQIHFKSMTLAEKASYFDQQVRSRHLRNGFNATLGGMEKGNISTGFLSDSDNDGLWTSMYLAAEAFRYSVTKDPEALQNCKESLAAMERLYTVNPVPGFPSRSFERSGFIPSLADPERWQNSPDKEWDWKSTTSSDEAIGHMFVFSVLAETIDDPSIKNKSILLMDTLMSHILKNDLYLIDFDGKPTQWGKWNPEYVNAFPENVGDRKLNSSNIISMLQTAYHFTGKEKYRKKAEELLYKHGYFKNLMRPMEQIATTPEAGDSYAQMLSVTWNHSDDEMYFLGYWGLVRYALNDSLKKSYVESIHDHWQAERPEKDGLWNIVTAITGTRQFDLDQAIWYLQEHPLDLIQWNIANSHRKDIELMPANFRNQTIKTVLPPDERPVQRHNANMFNLDRKGGNGTSELSAGDIWLLPYWLGRYLGVIGG